MKRTLSFIISIILCAGVLLSLASCNGRDISHVAVNENGELILTYTDGTQSNLGRVKGEDGLNGAQGEAGIDGRDGKDGINGSNGKDGRDGKDGSDGEKGADGRSIESVVQADSGEVVIRYSDGTEERIDLLLGMLGGECGDGVSWALCTGGMLMIEGVGETYTYEKGTAPWSSIASGIRAVYINDLTVSVSDGLLYGLEGAQLILASELSPSLWIDMTVEAPMYSVADREQGEVLCSVPFGSELKCLQVGESYSYVAYNGKVGYIENAYLKDETSNGSVVFTHIEKQMVVVSSNGLKLRTFTDTYSDNVAMLVEKDTVLNVTGISKNENWVRIEIDGKTVYAYNREIYIKDVVSTDE